MEYKKGIVDNSLERIYPDISKEWDYERNYTTPSNHTEKSNDLVWWKCRKYFKFPSIKIHIGKLTWFFGFPIRTDYLNKFVDFRISALGWKDKYNSPRHEWDPYISIVLFRRWQLLILFGYWGKTNDGVKDLATWEAMLDYLYYNIPIDKLIDRHTWGSINRDKEVITIKEFVKWK